MLFEKTGGFRNSSDGGCAVACLLEQPDKLMAKLSLSVDDQDTCHTTLTSCTARSFQDCDRTRLLLVFAESRLRMSDANAVGPLRIFPATASRHRRYFHPAIPPLIRLLRRRCGLESGL